MMKFSQWMLMTLLLFSEATFAGSFKGGNGLLSLCTEKTGYDAGYCSGYIAGLNDWEDVMTNRGKLEPYYCKPRSVPLGQLKLIVVKYLNEKPADLHLSAASLVANAIGIAFPCKTE